ncbi:hypothetical protein AUK11_04670 [bacterium CG2_30_37_16]|nr:MAG: hypothetical protein AUK11_04670 [bacterium CG2_30_37_16]PIP30632.1 MAG: hypothetical protein COX25_03700 [bacterium (Candidatus Howlettbacteria) CG23_combo_of_CG06-09_8_20_14_all_37_9]PIY00180.1 MAG: hypothetical protein COZ22_00915 [bacterium (Candidatus Howlettbacteria) CG_4_10_14_3_um_filter_37_10]PJB07395.1 MAG: hypothetical protein CO123_00155 [bacterium (Candidatus Howlettbacteria) CG_4_9_14_3_um_filter_37_10]
MAEKYKSRIVKEEIRLANQIRALFQQVEKRKIHKYEVSWKEIGIMIFYKSDTKKDILAKLGNYGPDFKNMVLAIMQIPSIEQLCFTTNEIAIFIELDAKWSEVEPIFFALAKDYDTALEIWNSEYYPDHNETKGEFAERELGQAIDRINGAFPETDEYELLAVIDNIATKHLIKPK